MTPRGLEDTYRTLHEEPRRSLRAAQSARPVEAMLWINKHFLGPEIWTMGADTICRACLERSMPCNILPEKVRAAAPGPSRNQVSGQVGLQPAHWQGPELSTVSPLCAWRRNFGRRTSWAKGPGSLKGRPLVVNHTVVPDPRSAKQCEPECKVGN